MTIRAVFSVLLLLPVLAWSAPPGLTEINGACPGGNGCVDEQFSVHRAPACTNGPNQLIGGTYSLSMVRDFAGPLAGGSSTLVRAGDGLAFTLTTSGLSPHSQYTVWWIGFNPDNSCTWGTTCTCTGNDLRLGPNGRDAVLFAAGGRTDDLGNATFTGHIAYGELPDGKNQIPAGGSALDKGAEVHFVVRSHAGAGRQ